MRRVHCRLNSISSLPLVPRWFGNLSLKSAFWCRDGMNRLFVSSARTKVADTLNAHLFPILADLKYFRRAHANQDRTIQRFENIEGLGRRVSAETFPHGRRSNQRLKLWSPTTVSTAKLHYSTPICAERYFYCFKFGNTRFKSHLIFRLVIRSSFESYR